MAAIVHLKSIFKMETPRLRHSKTTVSCASFRRKLFHQVQSTLKVIGVKKRVISEQLFLYHLLKNQKRISFDENSNRVGKEETPIGYFIQAKRRQSTQKNNFYIRMTHKRL